MSPRPQLDPLVHAPVRLAIMSSLVPVEEIEFTALRDQIGATDGNLATHIAKLEKAGYVKVRKRFVRRKPKTLYCLTSEGRAAFEAYLAALERLLPPRGP
ncbi:MAG: transcriptional regulator [Myxococcales bacterium]|nr:transcriptional regulator [Myxococcales bacterium]MCB9750011.1 transcriptional regulator [Myxococcales bacterium]